MAFIPEVKVVAFSGLDPSYLFRLAFRLKGATDARIRCLESEFVHQENSYFA